MVEHNGILLSIPGLIIWWNTVQHTPKTPGLILSQYSVVEHIAEYSKYTWSQYSVVDHSAEDPKMHLVLQSLGILWWNTVQRTPKCT